MIGLDATLIIDHFKQNPEAKKLLEKDAIFTVCEPVIFEFLCGNIKEETKKAVEEFVLPLKSFDVDRKAVRAASEILRQQKKKGRTIGTFDALIAGTYLANGVKQIATRNVKHFENIPEIEVIKY